MQKLPSRYLVMVDLRHVLSLLATSRQEDKQRLAETAIARTLEEGFGLIAESSLLYQYRAKQARFQPELSLLESWLAKLLAAGYLESQRLMGGAVDTHFRVEVKGVRATVTFFVHADQ